VGSGTEIAENPLAALVTPDGGRRIPEDWTSLETRALSGSPAHKRRTAMMVAGGLVVLAVVGWEIKSLLTPKPVARLIETPTEPEPSPSAPAEAPRETKAPAKPPPNQAARLTIDFEHSLKGGVFRLYVDDLRVIDEAFGGRVTKKIVGVEMRKGRLTETLEVTPGLRNLKVEVLWDDNVKTERSQTFFNPGSRLHLKAKLGSMGGLRKDLSLEWN
jgi:hypothetical protein